MGESPPSFVPAGSSASGVMGSKKFGFVLSQRPVGLAEPHASPSVGMLALYAVMSAFNSETFLTSRPIEPSFVPGRYDWNVPVLERSTKFGRKTLNGTPLNAVEISETVQPPTTLRLNESLLLRPHGTS